MREAREEVYVAFAELGIFIGDLIEIWELNDQELVSLSAQLFKDSIITSLTLNPREREEQEPFIKSNFQQVLKSTVLTWRDCSEYWEAHPEDLP